MARTQETEKKSTKTNYVPLKKLTAAEAKLTDPGDFVDGYFLEMKTVEQTNPETGELRQQSKIFMEETLGGNRFFIWGNAGMKSAIEDSCVSKGDHIRIEKLQKRQLKGGRTKNQYDVFQLGEQ